jgi:hypothetical protein
MCSGYVSDGDVQAGNQMNRYSGYLSEGGSTLYAARRAQQNFLDSINGMRKCMERGLAGVDDDDEDDRYGAVYFQLFFVVVSLFDVGTLKMAVCRLLFDRCVSLLWLRSNIVSEHSSELCSNRSKQRP